MTKFSYGSEKPIAKRAIVDYTTPMHTYEPVTPELHGWRRAVVAVSLLVSIAAIWFIWTVFTFGG